MMLFSRLSAERKVKMACNFCSRLSSDRRFQIPFTMSRLATTRKPRTAMANALRSQQPTMMASLQAPTAVLVRETHTFPMVA
jgi:hypothetical protein